VETLRIAIISSAVLPTPPYGYGTEIATYWLARELARMGHQVTLYAALRESRLYEGFTARRIPCTYGPAIYDYEAKALEWYSDEIHKHDVMLDVSATNISTELIHWRYPHMPHAFYRIGMNFFPPRLGRHNAVVQSRLQAEYALKGIDPFHGSPLQQSMGFYPGRYKDVRIVNYGVPLDEYEYSEEKDSYLLYLSRFSKEKGYDIAIGLAKRHGFRLIMAGAAVFPDQLLGLKEAYRLAQGAENIKIVPNPSQEEKVRLLSKARALVLPTQEAEAFGLVILEALASGTPVLTYKEFITEELRPYVYELNEHNLLAAVRGDLSYRRAREAAEKFSVRRYASEFAKLLKDVADGAVWGA
jgi:Glycosyltransferase